MAEERFLRNRLSDLDLSNRLEAERVLKELQSAVVQAITVVESYYKHPNHEDDGKDSIYNGRIGIAVAYMRVWQQLPALNLPKDLSKDIHLLLLAKRHIPHISLHKAHATQTSPIGSPHGASTAEINLQTLLEYSNPAAITERDGVRWERAIHNLKSVVEQAIMQSDELENEVLYGRAGLLWALSNLAQLVEMKSSNVSEKLSQIKDVTSLTVRRSICNRILEAGKSGACQYRAEFGASGQRLMWSWHGKFYLGAVHGSAGIIMVLLQAGQGILSDSDRALLLDTLDQLDELAQENKGHLPSSLPSKHRSHALVQICHGSPGLAAAHAVVDDVNHKAVFSELSNAIWTEGIVTKGLGVCHGLAGNAYPWLLDAVSGSSTSNESLSKAIAFLQLTRECPPFKASNLFRTPDNPFSLFEGISGTICAFSDACAILYNRLNSSSNSENVPVFGIPGLGGIGVHGSI